MPDYQNSKIYKITSPSNPELVYYGSTTQKLSMRMAHHRCKPDITKSGLITCYKDAIILLVENFSCNNKEELHKKEGEYILNNNCVNKNVAGRKVEDRIEELSSYQKKYRDDNKDKFKEYYEINKDKFKEYYEKSKEHRKEYRKKYIETNKDLIKKYTETNKDKMKEYQKKYREDRKKNKNI